MRVDEDHDNRKSAPENEGPELSKCIARSSDQRTREDSEGTRHEINYAGPVN
jgi:hypothetical protein